MLPFIIFHSSREPSEGQWPPVIILSRSIISQWATMATQNGPASFDRNIYRIPKYSIQKNIITQTAPVSVLPRELGEGEIKQKFHGEFRQVSLAWGRDVDCSTLSRVGMLTAAL